MKLEYHCTVRDMDTPGVIGCQTFTNAAEMDAAFSQLADRYRSKGMLHNLRFEVKIFAAEGEVLEGMAYALNNGPY